MLAYRVSFLRLLSYPVWSNFEVVSSLELDYLANNLGPNLCPWEVRGNLIATPYCVLGFGLRFKGAASNVLHDSSTAPGVLCLVQESSVLSLWYTLFLY